MQTTKPISFAEFRRLHGQLGFAEKHAALAWIFHHHTEGLLVFRLYGEEEAVSEIDLRTTQTFLDWRGLLPASTFDAFVQGASAPA